jgi:DNA-binding transcriptional regulator YhcF (GntR family)
MPSLRTARPNMLSGERGPRACSVSLAVVEEVHTSTVQRAYHLLLRGRAIYCVRVHISQLSVVQWRFGDARRRKQVTEEEAESSSGCQRGVVQRIRVAAAAERRGKKWHRR